MEGILFGLGAYLLETFKLFCVMYVVLQFKTKSKGKVIRWYLIFGIFAGIFGDLDFLSLAANMSMGASILIFRGRGKVLYTVLVYFAIGLLDNVCSSLYNLLANVEYITHGLDDRLMLGVNMISLPLFPLLVFGMMLWRKQRRRGVPRRTSRSWLAFVLVGELALSFFVQVVQYAATKDSRFGKVLAVVVCIVALVVMLAMFFMVMNSTAKEHYKELAQINERLLKSQSEYYEMLLEKERETRAFRHDVKNHFYCMRSLLEEGDMEGLRDYLDKTGVCLEELRSTIQTGNEMVNVILNSVVGKYPAVKYTVDGLLPVEVGLDDRDLCTIFFNLLENAFTAADKTEEKKVSIAFTVQETMWFCRIENSAAHSVEIKKNRMQTEKADAHSHGFGTVNAASCVERNGGELRFCSEEDSFTAELVMFVKN